MTDTANSIQNVLERLQKLHPETIDMGLGRTFALLEKMGNPHLNLPPVIHIAGTNGKGSTLSFIQAILESAGLKVHRYTSPELVRFNERYCIAGVEISDTDLLDILHEAQRINAGTPITFFEITTAAAFMAFAKFPADVVLLETGLGGRLDSTNVVPNPAVNVISSISIDHQAFLGDTAPEIALEKAGILRADCPVVFAKQSYDGVMETLKNHAESVSARPISFGDSWNYTVTDSGFNVEYTATDTIDKTNESNESSKINESDNPTQVFTLPTPILSGNHQYENASTAVVVCALLKEQGFDITQDHMQKGMLSAVHRGRFEKITSGFGDVLSPRPFYIDGGHNADAGQTIAEHCQRLGIGKSTVILGMLQGKDVKGFIKPFLGAVECIYTVPVSDAPFATALGHSGQSLAAEMNSMDIDVPVIACDTLTQAVKQIIETTPSDRPVLCLGSLHLVGEVIG